MLGFNTGVDSQTFNRAKFAQYLSKTGFIIYPGGRVEPWKPEGAVEQAGTMIIFGPYFPGERLDLLITDDSRKDRALDALRYWIKARLLISRREHPPYPWAAGALMAHPASAEGPGASAYPAGSLLFPPEELVLRSLYAGGRGLWINQAERWAHPDRSGDAAAAFAAGTMAYRIFCGAFPYPARDIITIRRNIREGNFPLPRLRNPRLNEDTAALIYRALTAPPQHAPCLAAWQTALGEPGSREAASFTRAGPWEKARRGAKRPFTAKAKRFFLQRLTGLALTLLLFAGLRNRARPAPSTK